MDLRVIYMIPMMNITIYPDTTTCHDFIRMIFISEHLEYITNVVGIP